MTEIW